jgi:DNA primase
MVSLRDLQFETERQYSVENTRETLKEVQAYFQAKEYHSRVMKLCFEDMRELPASVADVCGAFFIDPDIASFELPEEFTEEAIGLCRNKSIVFEGRLVYPVFDVKNQIMGLCGWDKFIEPKYLDSRNQGYKAKRTTLYGMEKLPEYYNSKEPVFVVEGIVCCLYLRLQGYQALALLGSSMTPYVRIVLKRFGFNLIVIPDSDKAGQGLVNLTKRYLPEARVWQNLLAKDTDDARKVDEERVLADISNATNPFYRGKAFVVV